MGQIPTEYLPPKDLWPQRIYTLPEFSRLPQCFNSTEELPDKTVAACPRPGGPGTGKLLRRLLRQQAQDKPKVE